MLQYLATYLWCEIRMNEASFRGISVEIPQHPAQHWDADDV